MALKATIYKADLSISDIDRGYYADHNLTIARQPSETDERMMLRVLAFALHASERLAFGKGISETEEPDFWEKDLTDAIMLWGEIGQVDERRLLKACTKAQRVIVYCTANAESKWWKQLDKRLARAEHLEVRSIPANVCQALEKLARRSMQINFLIQDGQVSVTQDDQSVQVEWLILKAASLAVTR